MRRMKKQEKGKIEYFAKSRCTEDVQYDR